MSNSNLTVDQHLQEQERTRKGMVMQTALQNEAFFAGGHPFPWAPPGPEFWTALLQAREAKQPLPMKHAGPPNKKAKKEDWEYKDVVDKRTGEVTRKLTPPPAFHYVSADDYIEEIDRVCLPQKIVVCPSNTVSHAPGSSGGGKTLASAFFVAHATTGQGMVFRADIPIGGGGGMGDPTSKAYTTSWSMFTRGFLAIPRTDKPEEDFFQDDPPPPPQHRGGPPPQQQHMGPPPNMGPPPQQQHMGPPPSMGPPPNMGPPPQHRGGPPPQQQHMGPPPQQRFNGAPFRGAPPPPPSQQGGGYQGGAPRGTGGPPQGPGGPQGGNQGGQGFPQGPARGAAQGFGPPQGQDPRGNGQFHGGQAGGRAGGMVGGPPRGPIPQGYPPEQQDYPTPPLSNQAAQQIPQDHPLSQQPGGNYQRKETNLYEPPPEEGHRIEGARPDEPQTADEWINALVAKGWSEGQAEGLVLADPGEPIGDSLRNEVAGIGLEYFKGDKDKFYASFEGTGFTPQPQLPPAERPKPTGIQIMRWCLGLDLKANPISQVA